MYRQDKTAPLVGAGGVGHRVGRVGARPIAACQPPYRILHQSTGYRHTGVGQGLALYAHSVAQHEGLLHGLGFGGEGGPLVFFDLNAQPPATHRERLAG